MNRILVIAIAIVLAVIGVVGVILSRQELEPAPPPAGIAAPAAPVGRFVKLPDADFSVVAPVDGTGKAADMSGYRGKALLVNLWATWCAPCIEELPSLGKLQQALGGDGFQVVTIAIDERDLARIAPFLAEHGAGNLPAFIDRDRTIDKIAKVTGLPTSLLVGRDGKLKAILTGDARWHCGQALAAVKTFVADGTVTEDELEKCE